MVCLAMFKRHLPLAQYFIGISLVPSTSVQSQPLHSQPLHPQPQPHSLPTQPLGLVRQAVVLGKQPQPTLPKAPQAAAPKAAAAPQVALQA